MTTESNVRSDPRGTPPRSGLDAYFHISERGSTIEREIRGGFATFFTMAYIIVLNPLILGGAQDVNGDRLDLAQLATGTALVAAVMTLFMGIYGRYPFAIAAGLGLNAVVALDRVAADAARGLENPRQSRKVLDTICEATMRRRSGVPLFDDVGRHGGCNGKQLDRLSHGTLPRSIN